MIQVNMHEAKTRLSQLVEAVESGEQVVIARNGVPAAQLLPYKGPLAPRTGGQWHGRYQVPDDFDAPWPEAEALFGS